MKDERRTMKSARWACPVVLILAAGLLAQTRPATQKAHNYARWEREIAAFEKLDQAHMPAQGGIVFTGSSTIRKWTTLQKDMDGLPGPILNRGFGGSEVVDATYYADRILFPYQPRMIVFRSGGNDLWAGRSVDDVVNDFKQFVAKVRSRLPDTRIVYISWSPSPSRWRQHDKEKAMNDQVRQWIDSGQVSNLQYIDTWDISLGPDGQPREELFVSDKLHFNSRGYRRLAERVKPALLGDVKADSR